MTMKLPLSTTAPDKWVVTADIDAVNPTNLDTLATDFSLNAIRRALRMAINVQAVAGAHVSVFLPGPGQVVARPVLGGGGIEGHRIGLRYSPPGDPSAINPNVLDTRPVLWLTFEWADPAAADTLKAAIQAHHVAGHLQWAGPAATLGRPLAADQPVIDALAAAGITIPTYTDAHRAALSDDAWRAHQFDLWWYGLTMIRYHVPPDSELVAAAAPLVTVDSGTRVSFAARGRLPGQPFDTERAWINPGFILSRQLDAADRASAEQLGLIRAAEPAWLVGRLPDSQAAVRPWVAIGNDDQDWRVFLPAPEQVATGFSFITSDRLYLAHGGTEATLTLSGGGTSAPVQGAWGPGEHEVIPNRDLRPSHPLFRAAGPRVTPALELRVDVTGDTDRSLVLQQDEVDIVRQEFVFHFNWTTAAAGQYYYQHHLHAKGGIPSDAHVPSGDRPHFLVSRPTGVPFRQRTPAREHLRLLAGDELRAHQERVAESARPGYTRTLLDATWRSWIDRLEAAYQALRAEVLADHEGPGVPPHLSYFVDRYADELGMSPDLAALIPAGLQISSGWRPPQHNERVDGAYTSFHQSGLALDVQPRGAGGEANRRPLAIAVLHHVAAGMLGTGLGDLRTAMLELGGELFVFGLYRDEFRNREVREALAGAEKTYSIVEILGGVEADAVICAPDTGEETDLAVAGGLRRRLIEMYVREALGQDPGTETPNWPALIGQNRYADLYWFGLHRASHVHVDF
jgi:hypothetical protein